MATPSASGAAGARTDPRAEAVSTATSIERKALVAVSGAILLGFVAGHLAGNLQVFLGPEHLNAYAELLHSMPKLLWGTRIVLLGAFVVHVSLTAELAHRNARARGRGYAVAADVAARDPILSYARKTMLLSGPTVLAFLVFHLAHLTVGVVPGHPLSPDDVYGNVVQGFRDPWVTGFYVFANVLLGLHLYQGGHSLFQSLGWRSRLTASRIDRGAALLAVVVVLGNVSMPLLVLARLVGGVR